MSKSAPQQAMLFEVTQTANADGSFTLRPKKARIVKEVGVEYAAKHLNMHPQTICRLCSLGEGGGGLEAYKTPSKRGNAKWRICWESVMTHNKRRGEQMRKQGF